MTLKTNVIIIHGCPSFNEKNIERSKDSKRRTYDKHWMPWITHQLQQRKIEVKTPLMPNPWLPSYAAFKKEFEKIQITSESILIGHSCGASFIVRWLGESKYKAKKLILVAPWKIPDEDDEYRKEFYSYHIDKTIPEHVKEIIIFTSNDEEEDGKKSASIFQKALRCKVIELKDHGHYTLGDMGTEEFPELLREILI